MLPHFGSVTKASWTTHHRCRLSLHRRSIDDIQLKCTQVAENSVRIRRPSLKKRLADESDEDDGPRRPSNAARKAKSRKRARTDSTEATPTPQELEVDIDGDIDMDAPVDIEGDANSARGFPYEPAAASQRNAVRPAPSKRAKPKTESKAGSSSKRVGKKRQVVWSDEEDEEDATPAMDASARVQSFSEQDDDDFELPTRGVLPKGKGSSTAAKNGKGLVSTKAGKRKSTNDDSKPIMMKDESKPKLSEFSIPSEDRSTPDAIGPSARGAGPSVKSESDIANDLPLHSLEDTKQVAALPAKRKFPTIKKNKPSASGPSTAVSAPIVSKSSNPATLPKPPAPPGVVGQVSAAQRKPALTAGNKDLDLFNSNIYAELFNKVRMPVIRRLIHAHINPGRLVHSAIWCQQKREG